MKWSMVICFLGINSLYDLYAGKILLWSVGVFLAAGLVIRLLIERQSVETVLLGMIPGLVFLGISKMSKGALGCGDGLAVLVIGVTLGLWMACEVVLAALFLSALWGGILLIRKRELGQEMAWIPFLLAGCVGRLLL